MREVSEKEYYQYIGPLDVVGTIVGNYPYTTIHKRRRDLVEIGRTVDGIIPDSSKYFLVEPSAS